MAGTEQTKIEVLLDGRQASDQLKDLGLQAATLRMEMAKAYDANDAGKVAETEWELGKLDTRMKQLRKETINVQSVLDNLSGATMTDLRQSIIAVDAQLNNKNIKRNSEDWDKLTEVKRTLIAEQKRLRQEMGATDNSIRKQRMSIADWVISAGIVGNALNATKNFLRESLYSFNAFEKGVKGLSSLTGLTGDDLNYLASQAKELSTTTLDGGIIIQQGATEIVDAYKMIGSQRPELLKNKEALNQVTQEAIILSEAAEMELEPAAKALTNSLNQFGASSGEARRYINALAAGSQAGAGDISYLSQAIEKSGTTASLMGLEFEQLVALIETAAPKFSEAAVAGNSLDKVLLEMKARQIGYKDGVFDVNSALNELSQRFAAGETSVNIFGKEHAKMVEVLVKGRSEYAQYTQTVTGTNKTIEQAATNTDTNSARLQQQKNRLEQLRIELGEKLTPLIGAFTSGTSTLVRTLISAIGFFTKYGSAILLASAAIATYTAGLKAKATWMKLSESLINKAIQNNLIETASVKGLAAAKLLLVSGLQKAALAVKAFFVAFTSNPWGLILTGVAAVSVGIYKLATHMSATEKAIQRVSEAQKEFEKTAAVEEITLKRLFGTLQGTQAGTLEWNKARQVIIDKYGEYLSKMGIEINTLDDARIAYEKLSTAIRETAMEKAKEEAVQNAAKTYVDTKIEQLRKIKEAIDDTYENEPMKAAKYFQMLKSELEKGGKMSKNMWVLTLNAGIENNIAQLKNAEIAYKAEQKEIEAIFQTPLKTTTTLSTSTSGKTGSTTDTVETDAQKSAREAAAKQRKKELEDQQKYRAEILFSARTALEQEDALNTERLQKAGLAGIKEADLRAREANARAKGNVREADALRDKLGVLEALQKQHRSKILKIEADTEKEKSDKEKQKFSQLAAARNKELQARQAAYQQELSLLRIKNNQELANDALTDEQSKKLKEKHQQSERQMTIRQTGEVIDLMQGMLKEADLGGIDLSGKIFTPEEKEKLAAEILKAREALSKMKADAATDPKTPKPEQPKVSEVDVLGMTPDQWDGLFENLEAGKFGIEEMQAAANVLMNAWGTVNDFMAARENKELKQYEKNTKKKKAALDKQLDAGTISQEQYNARVSQLDAELDAKKAEIENKQARRQKAMAMADVVKSTALAIMSIWAQAPKFDFGVTAGLLTAMVSALGAVQLATIAATPLPGAQSGGVIDVVRTQDGKPFRAKNDPDHRGYVDTPTVITGESGREFIASDSAVRNPTVGPVLDVIDAAQKSGTIARLDLTRYLTPPTMPGRAAGGRTTGGSQPQSASLVTANEVNPEMRELLRANLQMMEALAAKKVEIPWYGRGGIDEKMRQSERYEQNIIK